MQITNGSSLSNSIFAEIALMLAMKVLERAKAVFADQLLGDEIHRTLQQVFAAAFKKVLSSMASDLDEDSRNLIADILSEFVDSSDVAETLLQTAVSLEEPPVSRLRTYFVELNFVPKTLPIDFTQLIEALVQAIRAEVETEAILACPQGLYHSLS